jgi:hypothetical protein
MSKKRKYFGGKAQSQKDKKAKLKFGNNIKLGPNLKGYFITYSSKFTFCLNEAKKLIQQFSIEEDKVKLSCLIFKLRFNFIIFFYYF